MYSISPYVLGEIISTVVEGMSWKADNNDLCNTWYVDGRLSLV